MTPDLKIETNRANAQSSTGPRTAAGKAASSQNARKHGLTAQQLVIKPEEREEFDEMLAGYQAEINPKGHIQGTLFDELVAAAWNLRRIRILEATLDFLDPQLDRLARHKTRIERTFHRALKELKALQTERTLNRLLPAFIRDKTPLLAAPEKIAKRTQQFERQAMEVMRKTNWSPPPAAA